MTSNGITQWALSQGGHFAFDLGYRTAGRDGSLIFFGQNNYSGPGGPFTDERFGIEPKYLGAEIAVRYRRTGEVLWSKQFWTDPHLPFLSPPSLKFAITDSSGNSYIAGVVPAYPTFWGEEQILPLGTNGPRFFVMKVDTAGDLSWIVTGEPLGQYGGPSQMALSEAGDIYITGGFSEAFQFGHLHMDKPAQAQGYLARIDRSGSPRWITTAQVSDSFPPAVSPDGGLIVISSYNAIPGPLHFIAYGDSPSRPPLLQSAAKIYLSAPGFVVQLQPQVQTTGTTGYQWLRDGETIAGATGSNLMASVANNQSSAFSLVAWNAYGRTTNEVAYVGTATIPNLAARATNDFVEMTWTLSSGNYLLETSPDLGIPFTPIISAVVTNFVKKQYETSVLSSEAHQFFRLRQGSGP